MNPPNQQHKYLKLINNIVANDIQIQNMIVEIQSVAQFIKNKKTISNISQAIQSCLQSQLYNDTVKKLQSLKLPEKTIQKINKPFPSKKIYFNQLSLVNGSHSIALLLIPKGLEFSLHDHIDMLVLTKVLFGEVEVQSMDTDNSYQKFTKSFMMNLNEPFKLSNNNINQKNKQKNSIQQMHMIYQNSYNQLVQKFKVYQKFINSQCFLTKNWKKYLLHQSQLEILTPQNGNIHRLYAKTDCILIDILLPDYINQQHCHYYEYTKSFNQKNPIIQRVKLPKQAYWLADLRQLAKQQQKQQQNQTNKKKQQLESTKTKRQEEKLKI